MKTENQEAEQRVRRATNKFRGGKPLKAHLVVNFCATQRLTSGWPLQGCRHASG